MKLLPRLYLAGGTAGFVFGFCLVRLVSDQVLPTLLVMAFFTMAGLFSRGISHITLSTVGGVTTAGIVLASVSLIPGSPAIPIVIFPLVTGIFIFAFVVLSKDFFFNSNTQVAEYLTLATAFLLIQRWPLYRTVDHLAFVSYEDNAEWIQIATEFRNSRYRSSGGAFVLEPLMASLHSIVSMGSQAISRAPSTAFVVTSVSYGIVEFLGAISAGLLFARLAQRVDKPSVLMLIVCPAATALTYSALQIPQSTGHLTFMGALMCIWALGLMGAYSIESSSLVGLKFIVASTSLLLGMAGMWWPLLLILPPAVLMVVSTVIPVSEIKSRLMTGTRSSSVRIFSGLLPLSFGVALCIPLGRQFRSISVRDFFVVKGGLHLASNSLLGLSALSLVLLAVILESKSTGSKSSRNSSSVCIGTIGLVGLLATAMYIVSIFVGPEYAQNYSVQKITLLFALAGVPLMVIVVGLGVQVIGLRTLNFVAVPLIFFAGTLTVGWNLNNPRILVPPTWGSTLIHVADTNPGATILCTTSDPARNLDAYLCTRHASALHAAVGKLAEDWRHIQLFPTRLGTEDDARVFRVKSSMLELLEGKNSLIVLSLETDFKIADEDLWWMSQLPIIKMRFVGHNA